MSRPSWSGVMSKAMRIRVHGMMQAWLDTRLHRSWSNNIPSPTFKDVTSISPAIPLGIIGAYQTDLETTVPIEPLVSLPLQALVLLDHLSYLCLRRKLEHFHVSRPGCVGGHGSRAPMSWAQAPFCLRSLFRFHDVGGSRCVSRPP